MNIVQLHQGYKTVAGTPVVVNMDNVLYMTPYTALENSSYPRGKTILTFSAEESLVVEEGFDEILAQITPS